MNAKTLFVPALFAAAGLAVVIGSIAIAESSADSQSAGQGAMQLPPGWTAEDMQACVLAGTPGKMHQHLAQDVGAWNCKTTMWMAPGAEPTSSEGKSIVSPLMGGRYTKCEMTGEMPGMGPYNGLAIYGFDNVSQKFVASWIDDQGTGIINGVGELSSDGNTLTWEFTGNCPITKKAMVIHEVETNTGPNTKTLEMFGADPKSGQEFQSMRIELTKE